MPSTISIAMCTYNGARYVAEQLASFGAQTRLPDELVVCDDRSTDETVRIVEEFAARAAFPVRIEVNERNLGSTQNFGQAISMCEGELIALADQDDVWLPQKLERLAGRFEAARSVGLVFSDAEVVDESLRPTGRRLWERVGFGEAERRLVRRGRALDVLLPGWTVTGATMAFRSEFRALALEIPDDLDVIHDGWIALVVAAVADVDFLDEPLVKYRQHPRQQIGAPEEKRRPASPRSLGGVAEAARRANSYEELIAVGERLRARLSERGAGGRALERLDARLKHLRARAHLPAGRLRRAPRVLRELLALRYHQYSNGVASALKDLVGVTRESREP